MDLVSEIIYFLLDLPGDAFSHKVKAKRKVSMTCAKLNPDSDVVGTKIRSLGFQLPWVSIQSFLFGIFSFQVLPKPCL